ncbi:DUF4352 domain-containing protein [Streptococcus sp. 19428wC2_LYSM12]|uniref:DUF4352 domain-containing protein n=1 Tax=unclassified Streptococcus TaxID=2608887 RepID=UPI0010716C86|nr:MULTISPECIES: DUF4352 domain-containing protein [unclassified Streptococcus]MBF0787420.1 DUF4352 domain-containing protein [Streptococcus sp. 19428wC2_LYSM12]TFV05641.1 DUF4352 domain-containing protein [Streptococcus sp. LYSM12]
MKKMFTYVSLVLATSVLAACGSGTKPSTDGESGGNGAVEIRVKDGMYVLPSDESPDNHYLALNIEIKNKGTKKLEISKTDITLYNSDDEKTESLNVYDSNDKFKTLSFESLSEGKITTGYVVFEVDSKEESYEMHYSPFAYDLEKKDTKDITIKIDPSKYPDEKEKVAELAKEYITSVFLNGEATGGTSNVSANSTKPEIISLGSSNEKDKENKKDKDISEEQSESGFALANDVEKERNEFTKTFIDKFGREFMNYQPSEAELRTFVEAYIKANAKRAKITYTVKEFFPDSAVIYIRPETIGLENVKTYDLVSKFAQDHANEYNNYSDALKAAEKYLLEQIPSQLDSTPLVTNDMSDRNGFRLKLTNKKGQWTVDTSDYEYDSISEAFRGGLY